VGPPQRRSFGKPSVVLWASLRSNAMRQPPGQGNRPGRCVCRWVGGCFSAAVLSGDGRGSGAPLRLVPPHGQGNRPGRCACRWIRGLLVAVLAGDGGGSGDPLRLVPPHGQGNLPGRCVCRWIGGRLLFWLRCFRRMVGVRGTPSVWFPRTGRGTVPGRRGSGVGDQLAYHEIPRPVSM
jgi:hypothetical protein